MLLSRSLFPRSPSPVTSFTLAFPISQAIAMPEPERETGPHPKQALGVLTSMCPLGY